ncbi:iron-sulfur cluster assembly protein, partial [bacterium]|nr:iron-sulfur cluster assembly protein [bacterium]
MTNDSLRDALSQVKYPGFSRDIISFGLVKSTEVADGIAMVKLQVQTRDPKIPQTIFRDCHQALDPIFGGPEKVKIEIDV